MIISLSLSLGLSDPPDANRPTTYTQAVLMEYLDRHEQAKTDLPCGPTNHTWTSIVNRCTEAN